MDFCPSTVWPDALACSPSLPFTDAKYLPRSRQGWLAPQPAIDEASLAVSNPSTRSLPLPHCLIYLFLLNSTHLAIRVYHHHCCFTCRCLVYSSGDCLVYTNEFVGSSSGSDNVGVREEEENTLSLWTNWKNVIVLFQITPKGPLVSNCDYTLRFIFRLMLSKILQFFLDPQITPKKSLVSYCGSTFRLIFRFMMSKKHLL